MVELLRWVDESWYNGWMLAGVVAAAFQGATALLTTLRPNAGLTEKAFARGHAAGMETQKKLAASLRKESQ